MNLFEEELKDEEFDEEGYQKPSFYGILPATVRYDNKLGDREKVFYTEISALCNSTGKCTAPNSYFCKLYDISDSTVSRAISKLKSCGYIDISQRVFNHQGVMKTKREISIIMEKINTVTPKKPRVKKEKVEDKKYINDFIVMKEETYSKHCIDYGKETVDKTIEKMKTWCTTKQEFSKDYGLRLTKWLEKLPKLKEIPDVKPVQQELPVDDTPVFKATLKEID